MPKGSATRCPERANSQSNPATTIWTKIGAAISKEEVWPQREKADRPSVGPRDDSSAAKDTRPPSWREQLHALAGVANPRPTQSAGARTGGAWSQPRQIWYVLEVGRTLNCGRLCLSLLQCNLKKDGTSGKLKVARLSLDQAANLPLAEDRRLLELLAGSQNGIDHGYGYGYSSSCNALSNFSVAPPYFNFLIPQLCASGRFGWLRDQDGAEQSVAPLTWDDGPAWQLNFNLAKSEDEKSWVLGGRLVRSGGVDDLARPLVLLAYGLVIFPDRIARFDPVTIFIGRLCCVR